MSSQPVSVVMIARDAEKTIARALHSVSWADEICVADTGSSDNTMRVARQCGAVVKSIAFEGFGAAKQSAVRMASHDWILSLDSDEVVAPKLAAAIRSFLAESGDFAGAEFGRVTSFCGQWILHSGWYPQYVFRLFDRRRAEFDEQKVHESIICRGKKKRIEGLLWHYSYPDIKSYLAKTRAYARLAAESRRRLPLELKIIFMMIKPLLVFLKKLIGQCGFLDGPAGLWIACLSSYGQLLRYYYAIKMR